MANKKFTDMELVAVWNRNNGNESAAAQELGVTRAAVRKRRALLPAALFASKVEEFRQNRADAFAEIQRVAMTYLMDHKKLMKASPQQLATLMAIAYDKERLEQNLSTENIAHDHYKRLDPEDREMLKELIKSRTQKKLEAIKYDD
jgi:hypothetical protein